MTRDRNIATLNDAYREYLGGLSNEEIAVMVNITPDDVQAAASREVLEYVAECIAEARKIALDPDQDAEPLTASDALEKLARRIAEWHASKSDIDGFITECGIQKTEGGK